MPPVAPVHLTLAEARALALRSTGLAEARAPFGTGKAGVLATIQHLGYVQVDTVSAVQRAHHHILWQRVPDYTPAMLHELQHPEAQVFEYWAHAASYLPMAHYRFSRPLMRRYRTERHWSDESPDLLQAERRILRLVRQGGPLRVSDLESTVRVSGGWAEAFSKIERRALHELWMRGDLMIQSRQGFQKVFDLPERVLPPGTDTWLPSPREAGEFHVRQTLRALGLAQLPELCYLRGGDHKARITLALRAAEKHGEVVPVRVAGHEKRTFYTLREFLELQAPLGPTPVRFLSPFDNLVIQRKRLQWLFGFEYTIEIYVPAAKRQYGYFVLPILWGDRFIGRLDVKAVRAERKLLLQHLALESGFNPDRAFKAAFHEALAEFTRFQGCDTWELVRSTPGELKL